MYAPREKVKQFFNINKWSRPSRSTSGYARPYILDKEPGCCEFETYSD